MAAKIFSCLVILTSAYGMSVRQSCSIDNDCSHPGMYCYKSGMCVECSDCSKYNRQAGNGCAKEKNQCGLCLPGMEKVENIDGTFSCEPSGTITPSTHAPTMEDPSTTLYIILGSVGLAMFFITIVCVYFCRKYYHSKTFNLHISPILSICPSCLYRCEPSPHPAAPPPYSESPLGPMATAPPYDGPPLTQTVTRYVESDPNQTANAYSNPQYVRGGNLGTNNDPEDIADELEPAEDDALINQTSISHPDDEVTQPSTWSPSTRPENAIATGPTTFTNVLGISQLRISQPDVHQISVNNRSNPSLSQQDSRSSSQPSIEIQQETSNDGNTHISIDLGLRINATVSK